MEDSGSYNHRLVVGPKYSNEVPQVDEAERARLEEEESERIRQMHFRTAMFGNGTHVGTHRNPAPPTEHAPTWRERATGVRKDAPMTITEEAPQTTDPRLTIFGIKNGKKGPWRL